MESTRKKEPATKHAEELEATGSTLFRQVLNADELQRLRAALRRYFRSGGGKFVYGGKFAHRGLHAIPEVAQILSGERVLQALKTCTTPFESVLTGECDVTLNTTSGWHKDIVDEMDLGTSIYADGAFTVYKIAFYLQDQPATSPEVLKVRPGSHRSAGSEATAEAALGVRAGDAIVFDVRVDHCGQLPTLGDRLLHRTLGGVCAMLGKSPESWHTSARATFGSSRGKERMAVFMTFGPAQPCTYRYEQAGRIRHGPPPVALDAAALRAFFAHNIRLIGADPALS